MELSSIFFRLAIALGLGLLVGLQREHTANPLGGVRTFPMVTIFGALCALLAPSFGGWMIAAGLIAMAVIIVVGNLAQLPGGGITPGITTEVAMLLMFGVGAYLIGGRLEVAFAVGSGVAILLQFKGELHGIANKLGEDDLKAIMQFALISFIILPVLPDRTFGPYSVFNPRNTWLMVVLIVGISLSGYIAYKFFGARTGLVLGGILGGLISSTATTVSYARKTTKHAPLSRVAAVVILTASTILYARILIEIASVAPRLLPSAAPPVLVLMLLLAIASFVLWFWGRDVAEPLPAQENPSELKSALVFALVYAVVLFAVAAVKDKLGSRGLFGVAILSGLTDVDAITLSVSNLVSADRLSSSEGWRLIVTASLSNLLFKTGIVAVLGDRSLMKRVAVPFLVVLLAGIAIVLFWPSPA